MYLTINGLRLSSTLLVLVTLVFISGCQSLEQTRPAAKPVSEQLESLSADRSEQKKLVGPTQPLSLSDDSIQGLYKKAKSLVEDHFDISLEEVELSIVANSVIEKEVERETRALIFPQFANKKYAELFLSNIVSDQAGTYAALYAHKGRRILVNRPLLTSFINSIEQRGNASRKELAEQALMALLIHEAVHAADDKMHQIHDRRELNFRASFSQSAAYEGHAQLVTRILCKSTGCTPGFHALDKFMFDAPEPTDPVARSMQAVSRNVLEYSYVEGERFLKSLSDRKNGKKLIKEVLRSPPADPVQILDPSSFPDNQRIKRNRLMFSSMTSLDHPWNNFPWAVIETSPIKGLDMRDNPARRAATIDGFTRLITAMVGAQVYDQSSEAIRPIEVALIQTESEATADALAETFHRQSLSRPDSGNDPQPEPANVGNRLDLTIGEAESQWPMEVYLSNIKFESSENLEENYSTLIATSGNWIIQLAGTVDPRDTNMIVFAEQLMTELQMQADSFPVSATLDKKVGLRAKLGSLLGLNSN